MAEPRSSGRGLYDRRYDHDACGVGFLVHLKGRRSHQLVADAIVALNALNHRGACGCEPNTGDGAGVLLQVPDAFLRAVAAEQGLALPEEGWYGTGLVFLPQLAAERAAVKEMFEAVAAEEGHEVLGWRDVPTDHALLGQPRWPRSRRSSRCS